MEALDRMGRARLARAERSAPTSWCPRSASTAKRLADWWRSSTSRRARSPSWRDTRCTRRAVAATAPKGRPRSPRCRIRIAFSIPCGASGHADRGRWERVTWEAALDDSGRADPGGVAGRPPRPGRLPRRAARRRPLHGAGPGDLGRRRAQLAHERLLGRRPRRLRLLDGDGPPDARSRASALLAHAQLAPGSGALLQPPGAADHRGPGEWPGEALRESTRASPTPPRRPTTGSHPGRARKRRCCSRFASFLIREDRCDWEFVRRWTNWRQLLGERGYLATLRRNGRIRTIPAADDFDAFKSLLAELYAPYTFAVAAEECGVAEETVPSRRAGGGGSRLRAGDARLAQRRGGQPRRLDGGPLPLFAERPHRISRKRGRDAAQSVDEVRAAAP